MGWISDEFQARVRAGQGGGDNAAEKRFEQMAAQRWRELVDQLRKDVAEYNQQGGVAEFQEHPPTEVQVTCRDTALALVLRADLANRAVHYSFQSEQDRIAAPEGGIFSLRPSRWGRAELYSSDQRVNSEGVRRLLLEPVLFPTESAA